VALVTCCADRVVADVEIEDHAVIRRDQRGHLERQHRVLELGGGGAARGRFLVRNLDTLHDGRLLLVRRDDARRGDGFALALVLRGRQFQVDQVLPPASDTPMLPLVLAAGRLTW
jgi:hypothetical protein